MFVCVKKIIYEYNYMYSYMNNKLKYYFNCKYFYFLLNKSLIRVYTIRVIKHMIDIPHGIIVIRGITISIFLSLFVQIHNDKLS